MRADYTLENGEMPSDTRNFEPLRKELLKVGFREDRLCNDLPIPGSDTRLPLLAYSDRPFDSRTASVAVLCQERVIESDITAVRPLGAPLVFARLPDHYQLWLQGADRPRFHLQLTPRDLIGFFEKQREQLGPAAIYRAKIWGRLDRGFQLDFVDAGLLPVIEKEAGQKLTDLIERVVAETKHRLGWSEISEADGRWLLQSTFWLLAAKILKDKSVPGFVRLNLNEVEEVYNRLANHYHSESPRPVAVGGQRRREALVAASEDIKRFGHCGAVSTEALGFVFESALIDRATRIKLGTHSTPTWLVDYIIGRLRHWVDTGISVEDRRVFEPACGHAGFLIGAMRLLSELLPPTWRQQRQVYLRERLHGLEIDPRALEFARLSLTLADVPNPNGWALTEANMFRPDLLERAVADATIVLGNPPFENFPSNERKTGWLPNKAAETFRRVIAHLPSGGVFGFVLPQTFLHAKQAAEVRGILLRDYEILDISLFADKVFRYGEPESVVLIGRRLSRRPSRASRIFYRRVREWEVKDFSHTYAAATLTSVDSSRFSKTSGNSLLLPDLNEVWDALRDLPPFSELALVGQGFSHKGDTDPTLPPGTIKVSAVRKAGFVGGFAGWRTEQMTHELPRAVWLNVDARTIQRSRWGLETGKPQVLLNYPRVSREAWRLKAIEDPTGHAVLSDFLVIRSKLPQLPLGVIWAILNSPVSNAYAYCLSNKRNVLAGDIRRMPVPDCRVHDVSGLQQAVADYLAAARSVATSAAEEKRGKRKRDTNQMDLGIASAGERLSGVSEEQMRVLQWRIDAEVLRLYNLPAALERKVLGLFTGIRRRGVPFQQTEYFPKGFSDLERLSDLLAITADWTKTNRRRAKLIDLEESGQLTGEQPAELEHLQRLADARVNLLKPRQSDAIDQHIENLKRQGIWTE